jgi:predicted Rossmann-fold nucleotide-binding protein
VADADLVISVDGNWGTLYELTTAVISGKRILVLSGTRGISGGFEMLYSYMKSTCQYDYGESVTFFDSVEELKAELVPML